MKEFTDGLAKLVAIIVLMTALAVWTAALSMWAGADASANDEPLAPAAAAETVDAAQTGR